MHLGLNRLKMLALDMNNELERQKPLTDRVAKKMDALNVNVVKKNKDMRNILLR